MIIFLDFIVELHPAWLKNVQDPEPYHFNKSELHFVIVDFVDLFQVLPVPQRCRNKSF